MSRKEIVHLKLRMGPYRGKNTLGRPSRRWIENRILRRILRAKKNVNESEEGSTMTKFIVCTVRRLRWADHVARVEDVRSDFNILTGKPTGKRRLGRPRRRWEDNIRMDLEEKGINAGNWVDSAQDRDYWRALVNAALKLRVP